MTRQQYEKIKNMTVRSTIKVTYGGLFLCAALFVLQTSLASGEDAAISNVPHKYPVDIGAERHVVQGHVSSEAKRGTRISSSVVLEGRDRADATEYLRVEVRASVYTRPHVYHPDIKINTSDPGNPQFEHPVITFENNTLPYGMEFDVIFSEAFTVDDDRYIVVDDFSQLDGEKRIHFDVILKDRLSEIYVSNQLPFVVEIEYPTQTENPNAALFAGVLVLTIVAISLLIPFTVRAKRRSKAGKPICGCGSADDASDKESLDTHGKHKRSALGKDNLAMILDDGRMINCASSEELTTIQNRMMRSTSSLRLQPTGLDTYYNVVPKRPDFSHIHAHQSASRPIPREPHSHQPQTTSPLAREPDSCASSVSSVHNYRPQYHQKFGRADNLKSSTESLTGNGGITFTAKSQPKHATNEPSLVQNGGITEKSDTTVVQIDNHHGNTDNNHSNGDVTHMKEDNGAVGGEGPIVANKTEDHRM